MTNLVIVESPAKAKTVKKYLGKNFQVLASYGHVRDLIPKGGAVDPDKDFAMHYEILEKNSRHISEIAKALKTADELYLATDPDREGEAISWHLCELMKQKKLLKNKPIHRIVFHEITKTAINEAVNHPREISMDLVNAQQARRALDYLVGFNLSPLLWKKIRPGLSAGRVQSPALRMIVEREAEIAKFIAQEYWTINADLSTNDQAFSSKLIIYRGAKLDQFTLNNEKQVKGIEKELIKAANGSLKVVKIEKKQRKRNPSPPFITSTLQQEAARKLGFTAHRTMRIAQQLYEGIDIDKETIGLISYMRTDSVNLAEDAIKEVRQLITERYGKDNLPDSPCYYKTKAKNAQEAHEAIRPTSVLRLPENLKTHLNAEQLKLYTLIWQRTVACQMIHATINTVAIDLSCGEGNIFRANGSTIAHPGFISVYQEGKDDQKDDREIEGLLPNLQEGDLVALVKLFGEQHFTEPPPRYTEASLIKALEEYGIGRPSTYATIIYTLQNREYVVLENKQFKPTDVGKVVNKFLTEYFTQYVDYDFTANLEDKLDEVSRGENQWIPLLKEFWQPFKKLVDKTETGVKRKDVTQQVIDEKCPECGKPLSIRLGRCGSFIGCAGYPKCKYTRNLDADKDGESQKSETLDRNCPKCGAPLEYKHGRYGKFIGCTKYPDCDFIESLNKPTDTGISCPECKDGTLLKRRSRYGKIFYSCSKYPDCKYALWNEPVNETCPKCGWPILTIKVTKKRGTEKVCPQKDCGYSETG
jgi:DNA topoisomerase I